MDYQEQLQTDEWKKKRLEILERDNYSCIKCGKERTKFLGLSKKYGIKSYQQLTEECNYIISTDNDDRELFCVSETGFINSVYYVSKIENFNLENLYFALQRYESIQNDNVIISRRLICFLEEISQDDDFPDLNIHHKYYVTGKYAWEYPNDALVSLCVDCHQLEHKERTIPIYDEKMFLIGKATICGRCNGSGYIPQYDYFKNGICFGCYGHGVYLQ